MIDPTGRPRQRGHRYAGPLPTRTEGRRYGTEAIAIAAVVATVAATAVSAYSAYSASEAQAEAADYNKKVARNQAQAARDAALIAEENEREKTRRILAAQRADVGASPITSEGSPLAVMLDSAEQAEMEALRLRYGGAVQAAGAESDATLQSFYGRTAKRAGTIGAGSTLLAGAARAGSGYAGRTGTTATTGYGGGGTGGVYYP